MARVALKADESARAKMVGRARSPSAPVEWRPPTEGALGERALPRDLWEDDS